MEEKEIWKDISGWESCYQFLNNGQIKSLSRKVISGVQSCGYRITKERILKPHKNKQGYFVVSLCKNSKPKTFLVNRLICTAFHGPCPENMECRYLDGNPQNNNELNLCWGTHIENEKDKIVHNTTNRGEKHGNAKLTQDKIDKIIELYATGNYTQQKLADKFNVGHQHISRIVNYKQWKY